MSKTKWLKPYSYKGRTILQTFKGGGENTISFIDADGTKSGCGFDNRLQVEEYIDEKEKQILTSHILTPTPSPK